MAAHCIEVTDALSTLWYGGRNLGRTECLSERLQNQYTAL